MENINLLKFAPNRPIKNYLIGKIVLLQEFNKNTTICYINPKKIPFDDIEKFSLHEQTTYEVTLERVFNYSEFIESKYRMGFEDFKIKLSAISKIDLKK